MEYLIGVIKSALKEHFGDIVKATVTNKTAMNGLGFVFTDKDGKRYFISIHEMP